MDESYLYVQIAEAMRRQILDGKLKPGDALPPMRQVVNHWKCTIGTVQRAYAQLAKDGLITTRSGQGTRVIAAALPLSSPPPLRMANLVNRSEHFLLEMITGGYSPEEIQQSLIIAFDRWKQVEKKQSPQQASGILRFSGSHDLGFGWFTGIFHSQNPKYMIQTRYTGSLGGLIALERGEADLVGSHLLDMDNGEYNIPFIRKILPGQEIVLLTFAHRRIGLMVPPGNPHKFQTLLDLKKPGVRFINRQGGSGTRVWLEAQLRQLDVPFQQIEGWDNVQNTHSEVAKSIAEGSADVGLGMEAAAIAFGLDFVFLARERYDLVFLPSSQGLPAFQAMIALLQSSKIAAALQGLGGYDTKETGHLQIIQP